MPAASFTVNLSVAALNHMEERGWLGGKLKSDATEMQKVVNDLKQGAAIGAGVFVALAKPVWSATGSKGKVALTFFLPAAQTFLGNRITAGKNAQPAAAGASAIHNGNGGSPKVEALNLGDALRNGANPFALADTNRTPAGKYRHLDQPALKIATSVLELQDATREKASSPNVRTNDEAAAVVQRALKLDQAGGLPEAGQKPLRALLGELRAHGVFFGSDEVKSAANAAQSDRSAAAPSVSAAQRHFVRQVFDGSLRKNAIQKTDLGSMAVDLVLTGWAFLRPKVGGPLGVMYEILKPTAVANGEVNRSTFSGFAERINAKYGDVFTAIGEKAPSGSKLTTRQRTDAERLVMTALYAAVQSAVRSRAGSATQHGRDNIPPAYGANGGYFFTAFERMTPAEKAAAKVQVEQTLQEFPTAPKPPSEVRK
jgi:hypothetical protein